jgi:hypothetical protein
MDRLIRVKELKWWDRLFKWNNAKTEIDTTMAEYTKTLFEEQTKFAFTNEANNELKTRIAVLEAENRNKTESYERSILVMSEVQSGLEQDRTNLRLSREAELMSESERMKETWRRHEENVEESIRAICKKYNVEYISQSDVPFKGKPDNTIVIGNMYTIFDAKSPAATVLDNFPRYIKVQADLIKKYISEEKVRSNIFLVVPTNTLKTLEEFTHDIGTYKVHVIPIEALEPVILTLRKIEDYELAEDLDPELKDNLIKMLGKLSHDIKRSIQISNDTSSYLLEGVNGIKALPIDILEKIEDQEKAEKYNPPQEQRKKLISKAELEKGIHLIENSVN